MISHSSPSLDESDITAVSNCLRSGMIAEGELTAALERRLAKEFGYHSALAVGSGSQALLLALRAAGVEREARVVLPTYVCPEVLGVVEALGARAVLADIGRDYLLDPQDQVFDDPGGHDAVVIPSMFGHAVDFARYRQRSSAALIADWAQYIPGPESAGGDDFDVAVLSFEATKLFAGGEGGAVLTNSATVAARLSSYKKLAGSDHKLNLYPLSDIQSALILSQLDKRQFFYDRRNQISDVYDRHLMSIAGIECIGPARGAVFRYTVRIRSDEADIDSIISAFAERGISVRRPVSVMLHQIRPASRLFPMAESLFARTISLPLYPSLSEIEIGQVASAASDILS